MSIVIRAILDIHCTLTNNNYWKSNNSISFNVYDSLYGLLYEHESAAAYSLTYRIDSCLTSDADLLAGTKTRHRYYLLMYISYCCDTDAHITDVFTKNTKPSQPRR